MEYILETEGLTKFYGDEAVVNNAKLSIKKGEIYGLLGENGAGKTTLMKMLTTLTKPSRGKVRLFGKELEENSHLLLQVGTMIETPVFYNSLSAEENLRIHCRYRNVGLGEIDEYLNMLGIYDHRKKSVKQFSLGMKQRLGIARSIIGNPKLLILDEPINGLDPTGIKEIRELLLYLKKEKKTTIVISSHILNEIEQIAEKIGFMSKGILYEEIEIEDIHKSVARFYEIKINHIEIQTAKLEKLFSVVDIVKNTVKISAANLRDTDAIKILINNDIEFTEFKSSGDNLEDYYMNTISDER
ncbi:ATP-binding cassette domain-containing protein [Paenibacillus wynnii]|uniref:ABC transporter domain-containing protein n=1 Tax=Paenibacillus wynnii TaxID=268407 RepID=A0A098MB65_9BACL|nr:ATP-binding cassette domain-containing protein [Paenibacillus wynnii]KGE19789.1 hypothetical protein PWYN_10905 [Paenibacillus wynnii]